jgi:PRC-barrel domain
MSLPSIQAARGWSGLTVVDSDDQPLGKIIHIYLDRDTELPEWAVVAVPGRRRRTFVPLAGAARKGNRIAVAVSEVAVSDAPAIRPGRELSDDDAARLYGHYVGASDDRRRGARRAPGRGLAGRLKEVTAPPARSAAARLGTARSRVQEATRSDRGRRLLSLAGLGSALAAAAVAGRSRRRRAPGVGEALGGMLAAPRASLRGRPQRRPRAGRRMPSPPRPRARRSPVAGNLKLAVGLAAGYVLGARAGRERYERLAELVRRVAQRPEVQQLTDRARSGLGTGVEQATGAASDRLEQARTSMATANTEATASPKQRTEPAGEGGKSGRSNLSGQSSPATRSERSSSDR